MGGSPPRRSEDGQVTYQALVLRFQREQELHALIADRARAVTSSSLYPLLALVPGLIIEYFDVYLPAWGRKEQLWAALGALSVLALLLGRPVASILERRLTSRIPNYSSRELAHKLQRYESRWFRLMPRVIPVLVSTVLLLSVAIGKRELSSESAAAYTAVQLAVVFLASRPTSGSEIDSIREALAVGSASAATVVSVSILVASPPIVGTWQVESNEFFSGGVIEIRQDETDADWGFISAWVPHPDNDAVGFADFMDQEFVSTEVGILGYDAELDRCKLAEGSLLWQIRGDGYSYQGQRRVIPAPLCESAEWLPAEWHLNTRDNGQFCYDEPSAEEDEVCHEMVRLRGPRGRTLVD